MNDLEKAKALLLSEDFTCVLCLGNRTLTSRRRGVAPLLDLLESGEDLTGFCAADKVVGKATALLYRLLGVSEVYGAIMSDASAAALEAGGVIAHCGKQVPYIINRAGNGRCPMETATANIDDPGEALIAIRAKLKELQG